MKLRPCQQWNLTKQYIDELRRDLVEVRHSARELEAVIGAAREKALENDACMRSSCTRSCWRAPATNYARVEGAENKATELADGLADHKQRISVNDDRESVVYEKCSGLRQNLRDVKKARLDAHHERHELRRRLKTLDNERTRSVEELEDARVRVARDDERGEEEQLERNEQKRQVLADSIASLKYTLHAADTEQAWQHEHLVGWVLFHLCALDVLDTPL